MREITGTVTFLRLAGKEEPLSVRRPLHSSVSVWVNQLSSRISCQAGAKFGNWYSPSGNSELGASSGVRCLSWQGGVSNGRALCKSSGEMPDSNIVVGRAAIVRRVVLDSRDADLCATASPVLVRYVLALK